MSSKKSANYYNDDDGLSDSSSVNETPRKSTKKTLVHNVFGEDEGGMVERGARRGGRRGRGGRSRSRNRGGRSRSGARSRSRSSRRRR